MGSFSGSYAKNRQKTDSQDSVWRGQSPFLMDLYQRGADMMANYQAPMQALHGQMNPQGNPYMQQMVGQYQQALGQLDNQTGGAAAAAGVFGGGRHGVEQHLNQQNIGNQLGNFMGNQYQADQSRALSAIGMAPGVQFGGLQNYGQLLGGPTVLNQSKQRGIARSASASGSYMSK